MAQSCIPPLKNPRFTKTVSFLSIFKFCFYRQIKLTTLSPSPSPKLKQVPKKSQRVFFQTPCISLTIKIRSRLSSDSLTLNWHHPSVCCSPHIVRRTFVFSLHACADRFMLCVQLLLSLELLLSCNGLKLKCEWSYAWQYEDE